MNRLQGRALITTLLRGAGIAFVIQAAGTLLKYISQVLFARWTGPAEYGAYAYVFSWTQLLAVPAGLGLTTGVLRFIPEYLTRGDWTRLRGLLRRSRQLTLGVGLGLAALITLVLPWVSKGVLRVDTSTLLIGLWIVPLVALVQLDQEMARATKRIAAAYLPPFVLQPALALAICGAILAAGARLSGTGILAAVGLSFALTFTLQVWWLRRGLPAAAVSTAASYETREWLRVSFALLWIAGFLIVLNQADLIMIGLLRGSRDAGIYNAATRTARLVGFVLVAVNAMAAPMIASLSARGEREMLQGLVRAATLWMLWPSVLIALGFIFFGDVILSLFGAEFIEGRAALTILAIGQVVNAAAGPVGYLLILTGHQRDTARVYGWSALINVLLNILLIPRWGLVGASCATAITMALWNAWLFLLVRKQLGIITLPVPIFKRPRRA